MAAPVQPLFAYRRRGGVFLVYADHFVVAEWRQHRLRLTRHALTEIAAVSLQGFPRRLCIALHDGQRYTCRVAWQARAARRAIWAALPRLAVS